jgi:hypothetical protein
MSGSYLLNFEEYSDPDGIRLDDGGFFPLRSNKIWWRSDHPNLDTSEFCSWYTVMEDENGDIVDGDFIYCDIDSWKDLAKICRWDKPTRNRIIRWIFILFEARLVPSNWVQIEWSQPAAEDTYRCPPCVWLAYYDKHHVHVIRFPEWTLDEWRPPVPPKDTVSELDGNTIFELEDDSTDK